MQQSVLYQELKKILEKDTHPLHMPGHKRRLSPCPNLPYSLDLTEIPGADNLHAPNGILKEAMERTAELFHAQKTYYLVNGSTGGILAGIHALAPYGSEVIVARNCHKSVYHALELRGLKAHWLFPIWDEEFEIDAAISPDSVAKALEAYPESKCVIITSPTYEGILSDISYIAEICHKKKIPLFVDGAHGCHLDIASDPFFPKGALSCHADLVVESMHKTLPSLTQTALLHINSELVSQEEVRHSLEIYETSSPSYPLMLSLDSCTGFLIAEGEERLQIFSENLKKINEALRSLSFLKVLCYGTDSIQRHPGIFAHDPGKILIHCNSPSFPAERLNSLLRDKYHMETEMLCGNNILVMLTLADEEQHICSLGEVLLTVDGQFSAVKPSDSEKFFYKTVYPESILTIAEAIAAPDKFSCIFSEAEGKIAGEYILAYPPGIPLLVPGERITKEILIFLTGLEEKGTLLYHSHSCNEKIICLPG